MGSSLIYVAIVGMWAGLLIPMWLRRHEQETEVRSVDRFSTAMRILSRRPAPPPDRRYLVMPQRPASATAPVADVPRVARQARPAAGRGRPVASRRPVPRGGRARLMARRRRLVLGLLGSAFLTFLFAAAGVLSWWWQVVVDLALIAYVVHLRSEAKRARAFARQHPSRPAVAAPAVPAPPAPRVETVDVPVRASAAASVREPIAASAQARPRATGTAGVGGGPVVVDDETWEPVPVPLPTYVTAPVAPPREPAPIEEREPLFDQEQWADDEYDDVRDDELVEIVERRRAVGD